MMTNTIRIAELQHEQLMSHLYPGDGKEAVAFGLCGRAGGNSILLVNEIIPIPYDECLVRESDKVTWSSTLLPEILDKASNQGCGVIKFHSHPAGTKEFSDFDDASDLSLFPRVFDWVDSSLEHASVIVLPDGLMAGRSINRQGEFSRITSIWRIGGRIQQLTEANAPGLLGIQKHSERTLQAYGSHTFSILQDLKVGVVGCSGTGGPVIEQLVRNGIGELVLVDPDHIDECNLNRIPNSTMRDAVSKRPKVEMHKQAIERIGLDTRVSAYHSDLFDPEIVRELSTCDIVFGCMDSVDGRHLLNRLATYYLIPYFDIGVKLVADGAGGIEQACFQCHYLQPGRSSLYSRGLYSLKQLESSNMWRTDKANYEMQKQAGYIDGVNENKPAVVSLNTYAASAGVSDLLARLHPFSRGACTEHAVLRFSLADMIVMTEPESLPCEMLQGKAGLGDSPLLLDTPELSEMGDAA